MPTAPRREKRQHHAHKAEQRVGIRGDAGIACRAAGDVLRVVEQHTDALAEAKAGDKEIVALQPQGDGTQQKSDEASKQST